MLATVGEVLLGVVDDPVCADRSDHVQFRRAVHAGHVRSVRLGKLRGERTHSTSRTVDQDLLPRPHLPLTAKTLEGDESEGGHGRGLCKRKVGRLQRQQISRNRRVLGSGATVVPLMATNGDPR